MGGGLEAHPTLPTHPGRHKEQLSDAGHASRGQEATHTRPTRHKGGYPRRPVERLPGFPLPQRLDALRARPVGRSQPAESPPPRGQAPAQNAGALSRRLPSSGRQALSALIPALKLNTRAARRPPARWKGCGDRGAPATLEHTPPHAAGPLAHS